MLLTIALNTAQKIVNRYLRLDPEVNSRLTPLSGNLLKIEITDLSIHFFIRIDSDEIHLLAKNSEPVSTIICGSALSLFAMLISSNTDLKHLSNNDVAITGNIELAQHLKDIFTSLDIDWEEYLAKLTSDPIAHFIGHKIRGLNEWRSQTRKSLLRSTTDYLHEEARYFPPHLECRDFYSEIDILRDDVERLSLRVEQLQKIALADDSYE